MCKYKAEAVTLNGKIEIGSNSLAGLKLKLSDILDTLVSWELFVALSEELGYDSIEAGRIPERRTNVKTQPTQGRCV